MELEAIHFCSIESFIAGPVPGHFMDQGSEWSARPLNRASGIVGWGWHKACLAVGVSSAGKDAEAVPKPLDRLVKRDSKKD